MVDALSGIEAHIDDVHQQYQHNYSKTRHEEIKKHVADLLKRLDAVEENKDNKARLALLRGKTFALLPDYQKQAEELLSKALRLDPNLQQCWNLLGNELWKKRDVEGAKKMFENSLEKCGKTKDTLRSLSTVMRAQPVEQQQERGKNVQKSVDLAKEAVSIDLSDGESWYVLGNAYLSNFFANLKTIDELHNAVKAYKQAERFSRFENPDLYYNRAQIHGYLEEFDQAIALYGRAHALDGDLGSESNIKQLQQKFDIIFQLISDKGKINQKRLSNMTNTIPHALKQGLSNYQITNFAPLKEGFNRGLILTCKITQVVSRKGEVPSCFTFVDFKSDFGALSIYNCSDQIYDQCKENADVYIVDPYVKTITYEQKSYKCVHVFDITKVYCDGNKVNEAYSPATIANQTFQN